MSLIPITIITGFLGSGKTTLILNLIPQLPVTYKLALLKNEFGDLAVDSQLASSQSISGVRELLNGCICCNLVGQLGDALEQLRAEQSPDRIIIETSGSAFPATLALEVNRLIAEGNGENFVLDGVLTVIDVENWQGYEDTSVTARMQQKYTDFVVFNKWEDVGERRFDECLDRLGDLELQTPYVRSDRGKVDKDVVLGIDGALARGLDHAGQHHDHSHQKGHQSEVEVLSVMLRDPQETGDAIDMAKLEQLLSEAPKDEVYRIKGIVYSQQLPQASKEMQDGLEKETAPGPTRYILNFAFGRWTFTRSVTPKKQEPVLRLTFICAKYESTKWKKRLEQGGLLALQDSADGSVLLNIEKVS